ncbi:MAG: helix-turn-helix domain-containing protein [Ardenticatenaceae bacterium]|nr:helix-turn-helix domain-containing protein [Ardenticatenaceae bacterium]
MSIKAMNAVWQNSQQKGSRRLILIALAHFADANGRNCYPSLKTIAQMVNLSVRQVQSNILALEQSGEIKIERGNGRSRSNQYDLSLLIKGEGGFTVSEPERAKSNAKRVKSSAKRVKSSTQKGEGNFTRSENDLLKDSKDKSGAASESRQIDFPSHLDTQEFRDIWLRWEQHRKEAGAPVSATMRNELLREAAKHTAEDVCWLISLSIQNGWKGLFWERLDKRRNSASVSKQGTTTDIVAHKFGV